MFLTIFILVILVPSGQNFVKCANILAIYPTPSISHQNAFRLLTKDLLSRGHHLTVITADPIESNNPNLTQIDFRFCYEISAKFFNFVSFKEQALDEIDLLNTVLISLDKMLEEQLKLPEIQVLLKNENNIKFDLVIVEFLMYHIWFALAAKYNAPLVGITSIDGFADGHEALGNVVNPVIHPELLIPFIPPLNFLQRWKSLMFYLYNKYIFSRKMEAIYKKHMEKNLPDVKLTMKEATESVQLLMTNDHPAMGNVRPIVPTTIQLGFMHIEESKPLPEDLKNYLDNSEHGVIYMSLGSNVKSAELKHDLIQIFVDTFKGLKFDILWKWESDDLPNKPKNVKISKWLPQTDLLAHPKIKLFITQGGRKSMDEAIVRAVPIIVIPFLGDQYANARRVSSKHLGVHLELSTLSEHELKDSIDEVLKPEYKKNIEKLRDIVLDEPMTSREKAVWWVEYVIRHNGTKHLDYIGRHIPFYQKYFLDFIALGVLSLVLTIFVIIYLMRVAYHAIFGRKDKVD